MWLSKRSVPVSVLSGLAVLGGHARAQPCTLRWSDEFASRQIEGSVRALLAADLGSGPELFAGGEFGSAAGHPAANVARYDGAGWSAVGGGIGASGTISPGVHALAVFDGGTGPNLYAAGSFATAGGTPASHIARWDGRTWSALGSGLSDPARALIVFDDGTGGALFATGFFATAGGQPAAGIAKWDGLAWHPLGTGLSGVAFGYGRGGQCLEVHDDGTGPALYVGGRFEGAGGTAAANVARWRAGLWSPLGDGIGGPLSYTAVHALHSAAGALYAAGYFTHAGGAPAENIAQWSGTEWSKVGAGLWYEVRDLGEFDGGGGRELFAAGVWPGGPSQSQGKLARFNGEWELVTVSAPAFASFRSLAEFDDGRGPALFVGGTFLGLAWPEPMEGRGVVRWDGSGWEAVRAGAGAEGAPVPATSVRALRHVPGVDPVLYAGGSFSRIGGVEARNIARRTPRGWEALGSGVNGRVQAIERFDDGSGPSIIAGGAFSSAGGAPASAIAAWRGGRWLALGGGLGNDGSLPPICAALAVFDGGTGGALYAGGAFTRAGGVAASAIARWDGNAWSDVGGGMTGWPGQAASVGTLLAFDDGAGPALYAGGVFTGAGGTETMSVARWDGHSWSALGAGFGYPLSLPSVLAITSFDDGDGPALYAGGDFTSSGDTPVSYVAKWNGTAWHALGDGVNARVFGLAAQYSSTSRALHATGMFSQAGGSPAGRLAAWDGGAWSADLGNLTGDPSVSPTGYATESVTGTGGGLWLGGAFRSAGGQSSINIARWAECACYADCDASGALTAGDFSCFQTRFVNGEPYADCNQDAALTVADFGCFQTKFVIACP